MRTNSTLVQHGASYFFLRLSLRPRNPTLFPHRRIPVLAYNLTLFPRIDTNANSHKYLVKKSCRSVP